MSVTGTKAVSVHLGRAAVGGMTGDVKRIFGLRQALFLTALKVCEAESVPLLI